MEQIKIAIVDDQNLFRDGLKSLLKTNNDIKVIFSCENGKELLKKIELNKPDVILLDINMPYIDGFEACTSITNHFPKIKVLILSMYNKEVYINQAINSGAHGYLSKNESAHEIIKAIEDVYHKGYYFNQWVSMETLQKFINNKKNHTNIKDEILAPREIEIIKLICKEYTDKEIGEILGISYRTVETYRKNIMKKIGARKSIGIVLFALKNHYILN